MLVSFWRDTVQCCTTAETACYWSKSCIIPVKYSMLFKTARYWSTLRRGFNRQSNAQSPIKAPPEHWSKYWSNPDGGVCWRPGEPHPRRHLPPEYWSKYWSNPDGMLAARRTPPPTSPARRTRCGARRGVRATVVKYFMMPPADSF